MICVMALSSFLFHDLKTVFILLQYNIFVNYKKHQHAIIGYDKNPKMTHNEKFQHTIAKTEGSFKIFHKSTRTTYNKKLRNTISKAKYNFDIFP